jgi:2'-hydroxyisoflavone reductase
VKILIVGGTRLVGRHTAEAALARGHELTLFNRGQSNPDLFPGATHVRGDRDGGLDALGNAGWDVVIDTCGYFPRVVRASAERLRDRVGHYVFVSTVSVYAESKEPLTEESALMKRLDDPTVETIEGGTYGPLKVMCEDAIREIYLDRSTILRLGLVAGAYDGSDRFTSWARRVAAGGEVLAPGDPDQPVQFVDGRDVGAFAITCAERRTDGIFNVVGPGAPITMGGLLERCRAVTGSDARFTWAPEEFLLDRKVEPWADIPLWLPEDVRGMHETSTARADAAGMTHTPVDDTIRAALAWDAQRPADAPRTGLPREREEELLRELRAS